MGGVQRPTTVTDIDRCGNGSGVCDRPFQPRLRGQRPRGGHTLPLSIEATTASSVLAVSLRTGTTAVRFDNVGLRVQSSDGEGGGNAENSNGSSLTEPSCIP